jgi:hypothetical protein
LRANAFPVLAIFESKARHEVPLFQRQYVWGREQQWEPLWDDIRRKFKEFLVGRKDGPLHFLGAMVFDQKQTPTGHVEKRQVIDGQQRLTTLQIFLASLRDFCSENNCPELASECDGFLFNKGMMADADDKFKVWPTQLDRPQFRDVLTARSRLELDRRYPLVRRRFARSYDARPRMIEAYIFFYDSLAEFFSDADEQGAAFDAALSLRLEECFGALRGALQVVVVDLDRDDDAQVIFETLNARGEPLLPADLLRNYIFLRAARQKEDQERLYHDFWERFDDEFWRETVTQGRLTRPRSDLFLQYFLASQITSDIQIKHLFVEYKYWIERSAQRPFDSVATELKTLADNGDRFRRLISPAPGDAVFRIATFLSAFDSSTAYPLLLHLLSRGLPSAEMEQANRIIESYLLRRAVCGLTAKAYNRIFLSAIRVIKDEQSPVAALGNYFAALRGESGEWPTDDAFRLAWCIKPLYLDLRQSRLVYILKYLSDALLSSRTELLTVDSELTVEHIMPQKWHEHWPLTDGSAGIAPSNDLDAAEPSPTRLASEIRDRLIHTIGNLTLLSLGLNSEVSNSSWALKKPRMLQVSLLPINQSLHVHTEWNDSTISERSLELFEVAKRLWGSGLSFGFTVAS